CLGLFLFFSLFTYLLLFFFFNDPATTEIYTLSLHDALPIFSPVWTGLAEPMASSACELIWRGHTVEIAVDARREGDLAERFRALDRKSTRLNSSHVKISYAVFCLKKKKKNTKINNIKKKNK